MPTTKTRKSKSPSLLEVIAEHEKSKRRKRRTPARLYARALVKRATSRNKTVWPLLVIPVALGVAAWHYLGGSALAVTIALVAFLVLCEAWPEIARWAFQQRRMLTPFTALAFMVIPEVAVYTWPRPTLMAALAGLAFVAYAHFNLWLRRLDHSHAAGYIPRQWLPMAYLATGWTILAAKAGLGRATLAILLLGWLTWAGWFWFLNRTRTAAATAPVAQRWADTIANKDYEHIDAGKKLLGSKLINIRAVPGGWAGTVVLPPGGEGSKIEAGAEVVASVYDCLSTDVTVDLSGKARQRELFVLPKSPLRKPHHWTGPDLDLTTWTSTIGSYIDGTRVKYVWCVPGSGPWHDLIAGTTRSGKSRLLDQLLATSRLAGGYMVDWVIDPQNGQSLPDWVKQVDRFAGTVEDAKVLLRELNAEMLRRNLEFSQIEYIDEDGETQVGLKGFTPSLEYPQINATIDEAHMVVADSECLEILAQIGKMGSKCGIKLRIVVHIPLLSELGGSSVLRDMVASGNVIVLRTASRLTGQVAFQGALPVDPVTIPRLMPDGTSSAGLGYALGADDRRAPMRLDWVEKPKRFIKDVPIWRLPARPDDDTIDAEVISDSRAETAPVEGVVVRGPGGTTSYDMVIGIVKRDANRNVAPYARVSRSNVAGELLATKQWKLGMITRAIRELCEDNDQPVWSDDGRDTLYYKEAS